MKTRQPPAGTVVYVVLDFPIPSERFVEREIRSLRQLGVAIRVVTLRAASHAGLAGALPGIDIRRRPSWCNPRLWISALLAAVQKPAATLRLLTAAWAVGIREGGRGRMSGLRWAVLALYFARGLRRHQVALIHAHFASAPATVGLLLAGWMQRPWGFSCHASDIYAETNHLAFKARRANQVIACSQVLADDIRRRLPAELHRRVHTVHHGLDLDKWQRAEAPPGVAAEPLILGVGRFVPKKGFAVLVEACAVLRDEGFRFRCELIGAGPEEPSLARRIATLSLAARIRIMPWCPPSALRQAYARASVLAVPSVIAADGNRDNIPNAMLEALACEVPVVASALPAVEQILSSSHAGRLAPPGDPKALAAAIREVCSDIELSRRLRENGRQLVEEQFDQTANARQLCEIFSHSRSRGPTALV